MRIYKQLFAAGVLVYLVQLVFAVIFYKERVVLPDDANYVFELVSNGGRFAIFHQRFIACLTQWMPYSAIRLDQPLNTVSTLYSLNVSLFYFGCYLICGLCCRNYKVALALLLNLIMLISSIKTAVRTRSTWATRPRCATPWPTIASGP